MNCKNHDGNEVAAIATLAYSQAGGGRHRCAICAYELGEREASERLLPKLEKLRDQLKLLGVVPEA
jgi:hypothetical protein